MKYKGWFCKLRFEGCVLHSRTWKKLSNSEAEPDPGLDRSVTSSTGLSLLSFIIAETLTGVATLKCDLNIKSKIVKSSRENTE